MKETAHTNQPKGKYIKEEYKLNQIPANMLAGLAVATVCSALAVKLLKKGELALLMTLMAIPVTLICLNKKNNGFNCKH